MSGGFVGVLLAAGASRRFGPEDKLLAPWRGAPLVQAAATTMTAAGCDSWHAIVSRDAVARALPPEFTPRLVSPGQPMAASFHAALDLAEAQNATRLLIALADMPAVPPEIFLELARRRNSAACLCGEMRVPPVLLARADFAAARRSASGDWGARSLLAEFTPAQLLPLSAQEARDIDTPADL